MRLFRSGTRGMRISWLARVNDQRKRSGTGLRFELTVRMGRCGGLFVLGALLRRSIEMAKFCIAAMAYTIAFERRWACIRLDDGREAGKRLLLSELVSGEVANISNYVLIRANNIHAR